MRLDNTASDLWGRGTCVRCGRSMVSHATGRCRTCRSATATHAASFGAFLEGKASYKKAGPSQRRRRANRAATTPIAPAASPQKGMVKPGAIVTPPDPEDDAGG